MEDEARRLARRWIPAVALLSICSTACAQCAPRRVGEGIGQLTIRNAGAVIELINADTVCGFESDPVKSAAVVTGEPGRIGSVTWTVDQCDIDLTEPRVVTDCNGVEQHIGGRVRVSGTRTIVGTVSGDYDNPVVPGGPEAVTIRLDEILFDGFYVDTTDDDNVLTQRSGKLSLTAQPRLAVADSTGVCMIPTPNIKVSDIEYTGAVVNVKTSSRNFEVPVATSNLVAVNGVYGSASNLLAGRITVWDANVGVSPDKGLNPEYRPDQFDAGFMCRDDIRLPVTFECEDLGPRLAQGAARLTIQSFGALIDALDKDTVCGFASPGALADTKIVGEAGGMGSATTKVVDCTLEFAENTTARTDCDGKATTLSGRVTVSGTKRIEGRVTGDVTEPVVPMKDGPARLEITDATFDHFKVESKGNALIQVSGGISGALLPRVALDPDRGACSIETGIARLERIEYRDAQLQIVSPMGTFAVEVQDSDLRAVNGNWNGDTNLLRGRIVLDGEVYDLPTIASDGGLDPEYEQGAFDDSWQSCKNIDRANLYDCHFVKPLAQGASQLAIKALGTIAPAIESDETCGFLSPSVLDRVQTVGGLGNPGSATWSIDRPCVLTFPPRTALETDCNGVITYVSGTARVTGTKTIEGIVTGHPIDAAVPTSLDAVTVELQAEFQDFEVWTEPGDNGLTIKNGTLSGTIQPRLAIDTVRGACSLPTSVATFSDVAYEQADLQIRSEGKTFDVMADSALLAAQSGSKDGVTNHLNGVISIDGELVSIPTDAARPILDPAFSQATFDASWSCKPNMEIPINSQACMQRLRQTIGEGAARLLVQSLGTVTKLVNEDDDCGFESNLTDPDRVVGRDGDMGEMEWSVRDCELRRELDRIDRPISEDCIDAESYYSGAVTVVDGQRLVRGLREDINILFLTFNSIKPRSRDSVNVRLNYVTFDEFRAFDQTVGADAPRRALTIHSGSMSAAVTPILGENRRDRGTYDVATPIARLQNIEVRDAPITILNEGMTLKATVNEASLEAFNGSWRGTRNMIRGSITVDGQTIQLPEQDLDPEYDQALFDQRYECTSGLRDTVPPY